MRHIPMIVRSCRLAAAAAALVTSFAAHAAEQVFPETYLAETLPKGGLEGEQWVTYREGKSQGTYGLMQNRTEVEYGLTDRFMLSLYANTYSVSAHNDNSAASRLNFTSSGGDGDEVSGGGPATFGAYVPNASRFPIPAAHYSKTDFDSVSIEAIYGFLSPYKDGVGLAGYVEYTYGDNTQEIELKMLLQKNLYDDNLILAANVELELEKNSYSLVASDKETEVQLTGGASWRLSQHWRAGLEARNIQGFAGWSAASSNHAYSIWYGGPMVSFSSQRFFAMLGYERQLPVAQAFSRGAQVEQVSGLNYYEYEKNFVRLKLAYSFR